MEQMQNEYIQTITSVEDMPAVAADIVTTYCEEHEIDEKDIYPSVWDDIIDELYIKLFYDNFHYFATVFVKITIFLEIFLTF